MPSLANPEITSLPLHKKTAIIFDWDDTLLASTFLFTHGYRVDSENLPEGLCVQLKELENSVRSVLQAARQFGEVCVITNAETGWVQLSAQKFMPGLVPLLREIKIVSARSSFEPAYPESPMRWKALAFHEHLSCMFSDGNELSSGPAL